MNNAALKRAPETETATEYLDGPPPGWFVLSVMRKDSRKWDWVAVMVDVHPDDLRTCTYSAYRAARHCRVRVPGKHRNHDTACIALENVIATQH